MGCQFQDPALWFGSGSKVFWILDFEWWKIGNIDNHSVCKHHHLHCREVEAWLWLFLRDKRIKRQGHKEYTWADYIQNASREKQVNRCRLTCPSLSQRSGRECKDPKLLKDTSTRMKYSEQNTSCASHLQYLLHDFSSKFTWFTLYFVYLASISTYASPSYKEKWCSFYTVW